MRKDREPYMHGSHIGMYCQECEHLDRMENFLETAITGELPKAHYQCPNCNFAWRKRSPSEGIFDYYKGHPSDIYYPEHEDAIEGSDNRLLRVPAFL